MTTPAGWYDDGSGNRRWWDGTQWTQHVVTAPQPAPAAPDPSDAAADADASARETVAAAAEATPSEDASATAEPAPFAPPYTAPSSPDTGFARTEPAPATAYPPYGTVPGAPGVGQPGPSAPSRFPVLGVIGLIVVVVGVIVACLPPIALAGWGLLAVGAVLSLVSLFVRGRKWPGITGLVVAVVGAVLAVAVSLITFTATSIADRAPEPFATPSARPPAEGATPAPGDDPSAIEGAEMVPFAELQVGDCLPLVEYDAEDQIYDLPVVPCEQPHTDEIYYIFQVEGESEFPGDDPLYEIAWDGCIAQFEAFVGVPYESSVLDVYSYQPTRSSWARADDRTVHCIVFSYEDVTGTLRGAGY